MAFGEIIKNLINILYIGFDEKRTSRSNKCCKSSNWKQAANRSSKVRLVSPEQVLFTKMSNITFSRSESFLVLLTLFIVQNLVNSRSGRAIMATRDNRIAAESVGIDVTKFKLLAFTISAPSQVLQVFSMHTTFHVKGIRI